jgi:hypothetical protein
MGRVRIKIDGIWFDADQVRSLVSDLKRRAEHERRERLRGCEGYHPVGWFILGFCGGAMVAAIVQLAGVVW